MDREHRIKTTARGTFNQRVDKNFVKQGGGTERQEAKRKVSLRKIKEVWAFFSMCFYISLVGYFCYNCLI